MKYKLKPIINLSVIVVFAILASCDRENTYDSFYERVYSMYVTNDETDYDSNREIEFNKEGYMLRVSYSDEYYDFFYNKNSYIVNKMQCRQNGTDNLISEITYYNKYDNLNRLVESICSKPEFRELYFEYDDLNRITKVLVGRDGSNDPDTVLYSYDEGKLDYCIHNYYFFWGKEMYYYNSKGQVDSTVVLNKDNLVNFYYLYKYDANNNLVELEYHNETIYIDRDKMTYDAFNRPVQYKYNEYVLDNFTYSSDFYIQPFVTPKLMVKPIFKSDLINKYFRGAHRPSI